MRWDGPPWIVDHDGPSLPIIISGREIIAKVCPLDDYNENKVARLIAAAPQMLEALSPFDDPEFGAAINRHMGDEFRVGLTLDQARAIRAAIAAATGGAS